MDYTKTKKDAEDRKCELSIRLQEIAEEKKQLDSEAEKIKREMIGLDHILDGVEFMATETPTDFEPSGFTDKIRKLLSETSDPLTPTQIRDALQSAGVAARSPKSLLINVHTVLERIKEELQTITVDRKIAYKRKAPWMNFKIDKALLAAAVGRHTEK